MIKRIDPRSSRGTTGTTGIPRTCRVEPEQPVESEKSALVTRVNPHENALFDRRGPAVSQPVKRTAVPRPSLHESARLRSRGAMAPVSEPERTATVSRPNPHDNARSRSRGPAAPALEVSRVALSVADPAAPAPTHAVHRPAPDAPLVLVIVPSDDLWTAATADLLGTTREIFTNHAICLVTTKVDGNPSETGADFVLQLPRISDDTILQLIAAKRPAHVVFGDLGFSSDIARRVAARSGRDWAFNIVAQKPGQVTYLQDGGRLETTQPAPYLVCLPRKTCAAYEGELLFAAEPLEAELPGEPEPLFKDLGLVRMAATDLPLAEAELILSAGAGVGDWPAFFAVADKLGAAVGGSRVVCDAGSLPRARQVGASGQLVEAKCYIAMGISGAPQHLQGIRGCQRVVAVNTDIHAPIMARADVAIVANADEVIPAIVQFLAEEGIQ